MFSALLIATYAITGSYVPIIAAIPPGKPIDNTPPPKTNTTSTQKIKPLPSTYPILFLKYILILLFYYYSLSIWRNDGFHLKCHHNYQIHFLLQSKDTKYLLF